MTDTIKQGRDVVRETMTVHEEAAAEFIEIGDAPMARDSFVEERVEEDTVIVKEYTVQTERPLTVEISYTGYDGLREMGITE